MTRTRTLPPTPSYGELFPGDVPFDVDLPDGRHRPGQRTRYKPSPRRLRWTRLAVFTRDDWTCQDCRRAFDHSDPQTAAGVNVPMTPLPGRWKTLPASGVIVWQERSLSLDLHHVVPYSRGGAYKVDNLLALCGSCNSRRGDRLPETTP